LTNSRAFPIAHLDSAEAVMELLDRLLTVVGAQPTDVDVRILTDSHEAARLCSLFPRPVIFSELSAEIAQQVPDEVLAQPDPAGSIIPWEDHFALIARATPGLLNALRAFPVTPTEVEAENLPAEHTNVSVLAAIGAARASVAWHLPGWPPIDELSLAGQSKHAIIQATLNSSDIDALTPAHGQWRFFRAFSLVGVSGGAG